MELHNTPSDQESERAHAQHIGGDILRGADEIAEFVYGDRRHRRKVYNLVRANRLPYFRLGATLCARKTVLLQWICTQENAGSAKAATLNNSKPKRGEKIHV